MVRKTGSACHEAGAHGASQPKEDPDLTRGACKTMSTQIVEFPSHERPHTEVNIVQMVGIATACAIIWFVLLGLTPISKANFVRDLFLGSESKNGVLVHPYRSEEHT